MIRYVARAPGKVVISGAYAVLEGAPALSAAVDRYVVANAEKPADFVSVEVQASLGSAPAPHIDAEALRAGGKKLGLGSSAAILVASLAALELKRCGFLSDAALSSRVYDESLRAHASAQGGGSGVDVATSVFGGIIVFERGETRTKLQQVTLPTGLTLAILSSGKPASTRELIGRVRNLKRDFPARYNKLMGAQITAAEQAAKNAGDAAALITALREQTVALYELGRAAGAAIVDEPALRLSELAVKEDAAALPAGAGGGDVLLYAGPAPPSEGWLHRAAQLQQKPLELAFGARGVHATPV